MKARAARRGRAGATREQILTAAERLFAEHGVLAVSNRQVSEAAGQGNNAAVGYHFGAKADLVRAIVRKHADALEQARRDLVERAGDTAGVREWVTCLVRPITEHLDALGSPTWFARFAAQVLTDPALRPIMAEEALTSPALQRIIDGLNRCLPGLPDEVRAERHAMASLLLVHTCAERERALAEGLPTSRSTWHDAGTGLIDAITGLWLAPVTAGPHVREEGP
ncbi:DNA-binding transcriptional regulator, AcrR family [Nonomuraea maritima]|uniref:DNA-binding transcriptional regulator, AcrR family n=1 Tax=Nonomuraea maritima TaxID=683260 RepID=A0A1G9DFQ5_9ACTN|nr:TetR/AcrR family transcriptional regulator [Nonomuraea maritima]SDK62683.1 DNA-binding transcriptional regulator, AcrR family [Nonomuraea maritima]